VLEIAPSKKKKEEVDEILYLLKDTDFLKQREHLAAEDKAKIARKFRFLHVADFHRVIPHN